MQCTSFEPHMPPGDRRRPPADFLREVEALQKGGHRIRVELSPMEAVYLVSQLQMAVRHPGNAGEPAALSVRLVDVIRQYFSDCPAVLEAIRLGWSETP